MGSYSIYPKQFNNNNYKLQNDLCFVIMPFSEDLDNTYMVIESVANNMKIRCVRADNISTTSEPILSKICTQISQAYFIIVDISNLNPNVFYELGIAHVLRDANKVLIIKEDKTTCPSDIRHLHYYNYSKSNLKNLKKTIEVFFSENNFLEDLHTLLRFLELTSKDQTLSRQFVVDLSENLSKYLDTLVLILNNKIDNVSLEGAQNLLFALTTTINRKYFADQLNTLYQNLLLYLICKIHHSIDISNYISNIFGEKSAGLSNEWLADCGTVILNNTLYFQWVISWMMDYLKSSSPAAFDIVRYKIEIGIIKSKSELIDSVLINNLSVNNKTLVEHSVKLIKERNVTAAIPKLIEIVKKEENPYVVRSAIDALIKIASLNDLLCIKEYISNREELVERNNFIGKHLVDLEKKISYLQKTTNL